MKMLINDFKNIYRIIRKYYSDKYYSLVRKKVIQVLKYTYSDYHDSYSIQCLGIISIDIDFKKDKYIICIELSRPGILIGKAGSMLDEFKNNLKDVLGIDVEIKIIENNSFM
jgi:ribosomal protein S3